MIRITILLAFLTFSIIHTNAQSPYNVKIEGQIIGYQNDKTINYSISDIQNAITNTKIQPDSLGRFTILKSIRKPKLFYMFYRHTDNGKKVHHFCKLILEPGKSYKFISQGEVQKKWDKTYYSRWQDFYTPDVYSRDLISKDETPSYKIDVGQMLYNKIDDGKRGMLFYNKWDINKPEGLVDSLQNRISRHKKIFDDLYERGVISKEVLKVSKLNIAYYNAEQLAGSISGCFQYKPRAPKDSATVQKLSKAYSEIFKLYPVEGVEIEKCFGYEEFVKLYLLYLKDSESGTFRHTVRKGSVYIKALLNSKSVLTPLAEKNMRMKLTGSYLISQELESPEYAKEFLKNNPDMKDNVLGEMYEKKLIPRMEEFKNLSNQKFNNKSIILDKNTDINSYSQLLDSLKGNAFIIDFWGSWCLPCQYQFQFTKKLKRLLKKHNIKMVYISKEYTNSL